MKDGLISREAAIEAVRELLLEPDSTQYIYSSDAIGAVKSVPSVHAVPLDKLCEWLAGYAEPPLDALTICDNLFEAWKMTLTELMEEQDAAD